MALYISVDSHMGMTFNICSTFFSNFKKVNTKVENMKETGYCHQ